MEEVLCEERRRRIGLSALRAVERRERAALLAAPEQGEAEVELHEGATVVLRREPFEPRERAGRPTRERIADLRLERVGTLEELPRAAEVVPRVEAGSAPQRLRL